MTEKTYDLGIIGGGVAGAFAALRIAETHKDKSVILFELGRPPAKRRRQLEGWLGCFPTGDGKVYLGDVDKVSKITGEPEAKSAEKWVNGYLNSVADLSVTKNKKPVAEFQKSFKSAGFSFESHDYIQWFPESIHKLSKNIVDIIDGSGSSIDMEFDNEVYSILKRDGVFLVSTQTGDFKCKKILLCTGRSGWRWAKSIYKKLGLLISDDLASFGIRAELPAQYLKVMNNCHCSYNSNDVTVGPFSWNGSIIQEDHADMTITAFRSNENRWKTDKVFFSIIGHKVYKEEGMKQADRLSKLVYLLSEERVGRKKIEALLNKETILSLIPEFGWLPEVIEKLNGIIPSLISRGYFHAPDISSFESNILVHSNMETDMEGLFVAGEAGGIKGIYAAAITGALAVDGVFR